MAKQFDAKASEIRSLSSNQLGPKRTAEIRERMLAAGFPISCPMQGLACSRRAWPAPLGQSQLLLVHVERMPVDMVGCKFIRNDRWSEGNVGRS